jgi:DNA-binding CsgD family transcriptional regulator/PAS domain-containing protein
MNEDALVFNLIEQIYAASLNPNLWRVFLEKLQAILGSQASALFIQDFGKAGQNSGGAEIGIQADHRRAYEQYYGSKNIYLLRGQQLLTPGRVLIYDELCPRSEAMRSEFYNDWVAPQGLGPGILAIVAKENSICSMLGVMWPKNKIIPSRIQIVDRVLPHLQRAVQIHSRITGLDIERRMVQHAIDHWQTGLIFLNHRGVVLFVNAAASRLLAQNDALRLGKGGLEAVQPACNRVLCSLIDNSIQTSLGLGLNAGGKVLIKRRVGQPLSVFVSPIREQELSDFGLPPSVIPGAIIFIDDPDQEYRIDNKQLRQLYGLTRAEATICALLVKGSDLNAISNALHISLETVRTHLKHIFSKTGTRRQAELVSLLLHNPVHAYVPGSGVRTA